MRRLGATGFIGRIQTPAVAKAVLAARLPAIAMDLTEAQLAAGSPLARLSEVVPDSARAGRLAAEHFLERGFRHFAFYGDPGRIWSRRREEGFCKRLEEAGFSSSRYQPGGRKPATRGAGEQSRLTAWLQSLAKPVGVMASNDSLGRRIIETCAMGGVLVPDEVSVVGVDEDRLLCELSSPSLSSVALDSENAGYRAAELLDRMMAGEALPRQTILVDPLWVVARRSTEVIAVEDREVAAGLRFIRDSARRPIGVADVVRHSAVSRRALEIRFQAQPGPVHPRRDPAGPPRPHQATPGGDRLAGLEGGRGGGVCQPELRQQGLSPRGGRDPGPLSPPASHALTRISHQGE